MSGTKRQFTVTARRVGITDNLKANLNPSDAGSEGATGTLKNKGSKRINSKVETPHHNEKPALLQVGVELAFIVVGGPTLGGYGKVISLSSDQGI